MVQGCKTALDNIERTNEKLKKYDAETEKL